MNYLPKNRLRNPYLRRLSTLLAIIFFGAVAFYFLDETIIAIVSPIWKADNAITRSLRNTGAFFTSRGALIEENTLLKEKLSSLELERLSNSGYQMQENALLELAGRKQDASIITASVLTHPPETPYDTITIDAGSNDSIRVGAKVFMPEGPSLGLVSEVFGNMARVKLFSANGVKTNALLERDGIPVVLIGAGAGNFKFAIPRDMVIERGDRIVTPDIGSQLLAIVEDTNIEPTDSFKEVLSRSPTNIFSLRFVFVKP